MIALFKIEFLLLPCLLLYSFIRGICSGVTVYFMYDFLLCTEVLTCAYFFYLLSENNGFRIDKIMIICSVVASFISLFLLFNSSVATYFKTVLLKFPEELIEDFYFRGYGLSDGLFFSYPVILGFSAGFIVLGIFQKKHYILFLIPLLIGVFSNARSGLFPIFLSILIAAVYNIRFLAKRVAVLIGVAIIFSGGVAVLFQQNEMLKTSLEWGLTSFDIAGDFLFKGEKTENVDILLGDMLVYPTSLIEWLFGSGEFMFIDHPRTTDIGYLLRLNFGGIFYSFILLGLVIYMFRRLFKINQQVALLLFISLMFLHFKSDFFIVNPASRFFFFVYALCILNHRNFRSSYSLKN